MTNIVKKTDGDVLYAANLYDNIGFNLDKTAIALINSGDATYADDDIYLNTGILNGTESDIDSANSTMIFANGFPWAFTGAIYDTPNSTIDASLWTVGGSGTYSETATNVGVNNYEAGYIQATATSAVTTSIAINTSTGLDMKNGTSESECAVAINVNKTVSTGSGGNFLTFEITDGTTTVDLHTTISFGTAAESRNYYYYLKFDGSAEEVYWERYLSGVLNDSGTTDLSSLTAGTYYMAWNQTGLTSETFNLRIKGLYYAKNNTISSATLQTAAQTLSESKTSGWGGFYGIGNITTPTYQISADGGTNFSTLANKQIVNIGNAGTSGVLKLTTSEEANATALPKVERIVGMW